MRTRRRRRAHLSQWEHSMVFRCFWLRMIFVWSGWNFHAWCSRGRRPLIAGCLSLQKLGIDLPVTRPACDSNPRHPTSETWPLTNWATGATMSTILNTAKWHRPAHSTTRQKTSRAWFQHVPCRLPSVCACIQPTMRKSGEDMRCTSHSRP